MAPADGIVERLHYGPQVRSGTDRGWCGNGVEIAHTAAKGESYGTRHCHFSRHAVQEGERVQRGQVIGYVGTTGWSSDRNPHLHFEVRLRTTWGSKLNPEKVVAGCHEPGKTYPEDEVVLTWPLGC